MRIENFKSSESGVLKSLVLAAMLTTAFTQTVNAQDVSTLDELNNAINNGVTDINVTSDLSNGSGHFYIKNDDVTINGNGHYISPSSSVQGFQIYENASDFNLKNFSSIRNYQQAVQNNGLVSNIIANFMDNGGGSYSGAAIGNYSSGIIETIKGDFISNKVGSEYYQYGSSDQKGAAIYNEGKIGTIEGNFRDNRVAHNSSSSETPKGGALYNSGEIDTIKGTFKNNVAGNFNNRNYDYKGLGGAIYNTGIIKNILSDFDGNTAYNGGGALYNDGTINVIKGDFINNTTDRDGVSGYANGGAIINNGEIKLIDGNFVNNRANHNSSGMGGAIYNSNIIGSIIGDFMKDNVSSYAGGAIYNSGAITTIKTDFLNNQSHMGGAIYNSEDIDTIEGTFTGNIALSYGGAVYNNGAINTIKADFNYNKADYDKNSNGSYASLDGGAIYNSGTINLVEGNFKGNSASAYHDRSKSVYSHGGAIYNRGEIDTIKGNFEDNTAIAYSREGYAEGYGGAIYNYNSNSYGSAIIKNIIGDFMKNNLSSYSGGAIYNGGTIENIKIDFINNKAEHRGGAIYNERYINNIEGNFTGNTVGEAGGAIHNGDYTGGGYAVIDKITGNFKNNTANRGGAIYNYATINTLSGDFENNGAIEGRGGAIYNEGSYRTIKNIVNSGFKDNYAVSNIADSHGNGSKGGAIYSKGDINLVAENGYESVISGNYVENGNVKDEQAIYIDSQDNQNRLNLNLTAKNNGKFTIDDKISGTNYILNLNGDETGKVTLNNNIESEIYKGSSTYIKGGAADINLYLVQLHLGKRDNVLDGNNLTLHSGSVNMINNQVGVSALNNMTVAGDTKFYGDVDLANEQMDRFTAKEYGSHDGDLVVSGLNMLSDMSQDKNSIKIFFAEKGLKDNVRSEMGELPHSVQTDFYTPIFRYKLQYDNEKDGGYFTFFRGGIVNPTTPDVPSGGGTSLGGGTSSGGGYNHNNWQNFNPAVLATPVSTQAGAYATINETFKYAFEHADTFTQLPSLDRFSLMNANKYAISTDFNNNMPSLNPELSNKGVWTRPYTTFESIDLKNGPTVDAITYGTLFGFDTDFKELKNGWRSVFTGYIGYNGSTMNYAHTDTTMNGGLLGFTETFYKKNFWTALTASAGASVGESHTMYGKEDFTTLLAGIASKTGYNFEFKQGRFIVQPIMFMSYTFVNTFDYTNAAGVKIDADPLHTIQLNPSVRFISNFKNGWQPYASVGMVWNVLNDTKVTANNVKLPNMSVKPYVEYGVGIQRNWADKFTAYGQAMIRNGGRNGVALTGGFRWAIGSESKGKNKHMIKENI